MNRPIDRRERPGQRARLPLLDRLLETDQPDQATPSPAEALERLRRSVRRDLEALLNARRRRLPLDPTLTELPSSLVGYGIPDPTSGAYAVPEIRAALVAEIEATIRRFEPRLTQVSVKLLDDTDELSRTLRMKVEAILMADTIEEEVSFETSLETVTRDVTVREI